MSAMIVTRVIRLAPTSMKRLRIAVLMIDAGASDRAMTEDERERELECAANLALVYVEPGADPRSEWSPQMLNRWTGRPVPPAAAEYAASPDPVFEYGPRWAPRKAPDVAGRRDPQDRYVPHDVRRWRDPAHRAELKRRAAQGEADFVDLLARAITVAGEQATHSRLGVPRSSVDRWRRGLSLPHPAVRARFVRLLREIAP